MKILGKLRNLSLGTGMGNKKYADNRLSQLDLTLSHTKLWKSSYCEITYWARYTHNTTHVRRFNNSNATDEETEYKQTEQTEL